MRIGDEVETVSQLWHNGHDIGNRLGRIIDNRGHLIVELYDFNDNPIKCFRNEVALTTPEIEDIELDFDINGDVLPWPLV